MPTPPLPGWLLDSINAFPTPVREQLLGYATTAWDAGYQLGNTDARKRRRQPPAEPAAEPAAEPETGGQTDG